MTQHDVDTLVSTIASLSEPRSLAQLRRDTVAVLPSLVRSSLVAWNELDLASGAALVVFDDWYEPTLEQGEVFTSIMGEHPLVTRYLRTGDGRPYKISDFLDEDQYHTSRIYREFYRQIGAEDQMAFELPEPSLVIGLALNRERRDFTERDRSVLNLFRPYLVQAYQTAEALERSQEVLATLTELATDAGDGLVMLDTTGRIAGFAGGASDLLRRWFPDTHGAGLPDDVHDWLRTGRHSTGLVPSAPFVYERAPHKLVVRLLPGCNGDDRMLLVSERGATLSALEWLRACGLTRREAEVVELASGGHTNIQIARRLGISSRTVEKHMQRGLDKLGVENRTAAASLLRDATDRRGSGTPGGAAADENTGRDAGI
ncbi:MAG TPA: helix-turn-helix transcriptional regulator [Acidimicrobiia bacterium]